MKKIFSFCGQVRKHCIIDLEMYYIESSIPSPHFYLQIGCSCLFLVLKSFIKKKRPSGMGRSDLGMIILPLDFQMSQPDEG